jgi:hypothetical protein
MSQFRRVSVSGGRNGRLAPCAILLSRVTLLALPPLQWALARVQASVRSEVLSRWGTAGSGGWWKIPVLDDEEQWWVD